MSERVIKRAGETTAEARERLKQEAIDAYVATLIAKAPLLTPERGARLASIVARSRS